MTNKEKREYIGLMEAYSTTPSLADIEKRKYFDSKTPKVLFKYRKFDEFTFDMLDNGYIYLTPAENLDDPFDCLTDPNLSTTSTDDAYVITDEMENRVVDIVFSYSHSKGFTKEDIKKMIRKCAKNGEIDTVCFNEWVKSALGLQRDYINVFDSVMFAFYDAFKTLSTNEGMKESLQKLANSRASFGVCALTRARDNQTMWSLYSDVYKGYCVEYLTPNLKDIILNLYPVIYSKKSNNDLIKILVDLSMATALRGFGDVKAALPMAGAIPMMLCTKDSTWKYQNEWRLIGTPNLKVNKFQAKRVYLGFDVSIENENKMIECSKRNGFEVFKMNGSTGDRRITYRKIN